MDIARNYFEETMHPFFEKIEKQNGQMIDMLQLLLIGVDDDEVGRKEILTKLEDIRVSTTDIQIKLDDILEKLTSIENEFAEIKTEHRDIEQKLNLMVSKLQKLEDSVSEEDIEDYRKMAKSLYVNWESLDGLTKRFIPLAEYLYSKLQKYDKADYSPVILELCRAIENEFLLKIFRKYTMNLIGRKQRNLDAFLYTDRSDTLLVKKTGQFVKAISKAAKTTKPEYTLGQMNAILSILTETQIVNLSPLLQDFENYLYVNTEAGRLLDVDYIQKINDIVNNYRNPAAHPDFMSIQKADECREVMPDRIDYLLDCIS